MYVVLKFLSCLQFQYQTAGIRKLLYGQPDQEKTVFDEFPKAKIDRMKGLEVVSSQD